MPRREVPNAAVEVGAPVSPYLMGAMRDNDQYFDNARASIESQLDVTTGHKHTAEVETFGYFFSDRIITRAGINDQLSFAYAGGAVALAEHTVTLDAGTRTLVAHALHVQTKMRAAASGTTNISVGYDSTTGSETRGFFNFGHNGSSDTPNARVFKLLFGSGAGVTRSGAKAIGYRKEDLIGSNGYSGTSGFTDGLRQDTIEVGNGSELGSDAFVDDAFTTVKFKDGIAPTAAFKNNAVSGSAGAGKVSANAVIGTKIGPAEVGDIGPVGNGINGVVVMSIPNGGIHGRKPTIMFTCNEAVTFSGLTMVDVSPTGGANDWTVTCRNQSGGPLTGVKALGY